MTNEEKQIIFNRVHSLYTSAIYDYSKTDDFKKMQEVTRTFKEFIIIFQENIKDELEETNHLTQLSFRNIENDRKILKQKKKTIRNS